MSPLLASHRWSPPRVTRPVVSTLLLVDRMPSALLLIG